MHALTVSNGRHVSGNPRGWARSTPMRGDQPGSGVEPHTFTDVMDVEHG